MNWSQYLQSFTEVLNGLVTTQPYDDEKYIHYVKMNQARMNRWLKNPEILDNDSKEQLKALSSKQKWVLITEPWCGDAAHISPILHFMSEQSAFIDLEIILRDSSDNLIDQYLTNGGRAVPKLIIRDEQDNDLFIWGPRPSVLTAYIEELKRAECSAETKDTAIQTWYNNDKGKEIIKEVIAFVNSYSISSVKD